MDTHERTNESYTIAWLCALPIEQAAAQGMLDERHPDLSAAKDDSNNYRFGRIGKHDVVIAVLGSRSHGTAPAATAAANLLRSFPNIRFGLMVGVGGGAPRKPQKNPLNDIRLGDVVVSTPTGEYAGVVQYDFGKSLEEGKFIRTGSLNGAPKILSTAVAGLQGDALLQGYQIRPFVDKLLAEYSRSVFDYPGDESDQLFASDYSHINDPDTDEDECTLCESAASIRRTQRTDPRTPAVHYGLIGSANNLMRDAKLRDKLRQELNIMCFEMEAGGLRNDFPCLIVRGISDYCDSHKNKRWQPYAAATAAAYTKRLLYVIAPETVAQEQLAREIAITLQTHTGKLDDLKGIVANVEAKLDFGALPSVRDAAFDSHADYDEEDSTCLPGTRISILNIIQTWATDATGKLIFWLNGMAGTGKSTIARSVARDFASRKQLAASFFFKRGEHDREHVRYFFPTIAKQFTRSLPFLRDGIGKAIDEAPDIGHKALKEQFEQLILLPLKGSITQLKSPVLIVVDALDECRDRHQMELIIKLLSELRSVGSPNLRILLTSRRENDLDQSFENIVAGIFDDVVLHEITETTIEQDIGRYLERKFDLIKAKRRVELPANWPGDEVLKTLTAMSSPLFIFAATICRFIGNRQSNPARCLRTVLQKRHGNLDKLQQTYSIILEGLLDVSSSEQNYRIRSFHLIVGTIATLYEPLSQLALGKLLNVEHEEINNMLFCLSSVLRVSKDQNVVVRFLHASFIDYLINPQEDHTFRINTAEAHKKIAHRCLNILLVSSCLSKQDICNQRNPGVLRKNIATSIVEDKLAAEVRYACCRWIFHLRESCRPISEFEDQICAFFKHRFLIWFEALSLLGKAGEAPSLLFDLMELSSGSPNSNLKDTVYDGRRFVMANTYIVDKAPLQLYSSCLVFTPQHSLIRSNASMPTWLEGTPAVPDNWPALLQTLEGHQSHVSCLAYSSDGNLLVSGSLDREVKLWNTSSGQLQQTLRQSNTVSSVTLSPDGKLLATGLQGGTISVWDINLGELQHSISAHPDDVESLVFSSDSNLLASSSCDQTVKLWWSASGQSKFIFKDHLGSVIGLAFSRSEDEKLLSLYNNYCVKLWDITSGTLQLSLTLEGQPGYLRSVSFSPEDPNLLAVVANNGAVQIWDISKGSIQVTVEREIRSALDVCLAPNGKFLASVSFTGSIKLWNITSRQLTLHRKLVRDGAPPMAFSPDSSILASGGTDTISLWDVDSQAVAAAAEEEEEEEEEEAEAETRIMSITFSHNKEMLASCSLGGRIKLWTLTAGQLQLLATFYGGNHTIAFSPNSRLLSFGMQETIKIWSIAKSTMWRSFDLNLGFITSTAFSLDSKLLVARDFTLGKCSIWNVDTGQMIRELKSEEMRNLVACSSIGYLIATCERNEDRGIHGHLKVDRHIKVWDTNNGRLIKHIKPPNNIHKLEFAEDSSSLRTNAGTYCIWETTDHASQQWTDPARYDIQDGWILHRGQKLFWLPSDYRRHFDYIEELFAFGLSSGAIVFLKFSSEELDRQNYERLEEDDEYSYESCSQESGKEVEENDKDEDDDEASDERYSRGLSEEDEEDE